MSEIYLDEDEIEKIKVILVGNAGVGKTNLINIAGGGSFNPSPITKIKDSFIKTDITVDKKQFKLYLWDTVGLENLRNLTKLFFENSKIVIFVYDISNKNSFEDLNFWINDVKNNIGDNIIKGVLGNKLDLYLNEEVKDEEGEEFADSINAKFKAISAKIKPQDFCDFLKELLIEYNNKNKENKNLKINENIILNTKSQKHKNFKKC